MSAFTREQLEDMAPVSGIYAFALALLGQKEKAEAERDSFRLEADRLREKLREAEKRMKAWGCPDFDFICLNCGRETPCITEADLRPGDPGVPCTFDLTYPQMIERLRRYEDRQRKAEAERDEARAMKVPATTEAVTLAEMGEKVARTEAWAAKEELREAEEAIREAIEELSDGVTFEDERVSYVEMQVGREWRIEWLQSPAVRRARERAGRG